MFVSGASDHCRMASKARVTPKICWKGDGAKVNLFLIFLCLHVDKRKHLTSVGFVECSVFCRRLGLQVDELSTGPLGTSFRDCSSHLLQLCFCIIISKVIQAIVFILSNEIHRIDRKRRLFASALKEIKIFLSNLMIDERERVDHKIVQSRDCKN